MNKHWNKEDETTLFNEYFYGSDKGDVPLKQIAASLGRTESACRAKLHRLCYKKNNRKSEL